MIFDFIKKLFRKKDSIESYKYHTFLEKKHMTHFPEFTQVSDDEWECYFSLGNSINIIFSDSNVNWASVYLSKGDPSSGYTTLLYDENPSCGSIELVLDRYDNNRKLRRLRDEKISKILE
jgi:hypothetical protein